MSIAELAQAIARLTGFTGRIVYDTTKPDGAPRKLLDTSRLAGMGWKARTPFLDALQATYAWYLKSRDGELRSL